jgi:hypothetical protein
MVLLQVHNIMVQKQIRKQNVVFLQQILISNYSLSAHLQMRLTITFNCQELTQYQNHEWQWNAQEYFMYIFNIDQFTSPSPYINHKYLHIYTWSKSKLNDSLH